MRCFCLWVCLLACGAVAAAPASAGEPTAWQKFWHRVHLDWHRNNAWPEPFNHIDRQAAWEPWEVMKAKGWQTQCTLGQAYFDPETQKLNRAGLAKVRWIATQAPESRRVLFVVQGHNEEATAVRVDEVQQAAARAVVGGPLPEVVQTPFEPSGLRGEDVQVYTEQYRKAIPAPVLPAAAAPTSGS